MAAAPGAFGESDDVVVVLGLLGDERLGGANVKNFVTGIVVVALHLRQPTDEREKRRHGLAVARGRAKDYVAVFIGFDKKLSNRVDLHVFKVLPLLVLHPFLHGLLQAPEFL